MKQIVITKQRELDKLTEIPIGTEIILNAELSLNANLSVIGKLVINCNLKCGLYRIVSRGNSSPSIESWGNSSPSIVSLENSSPSIVSRGNSSPSIVSWGNSSPSIVSLENSSPSIVSLENSSPSIESWGNSVLRVSSNIAKEIVLHGFSILIADAKFKLTIKKSVHCLIQRTEQLVDWFESNGVEKTNSVVLYKRVSSDWKTQEGTPNETLWAIGTILEHPNWRPTNSECGGGRFHACSRPYFCDEFRSNKGDRYIAIEIALKDTHAWENPLYPHKIAFRRGKVLYECNRHGKRLE